MGRLRLGDRLTAADLAVNRWVTLSVAADALRAVAEAELVEAQPDGSYIVRGRPAGTPRFRADRYAWLQTADFLAERIKAGEFADTGKLPGEAALGRQYRIGRQTVRRARHELMERGLVYWRRGYGTFIA